MTLPLDFTTRLTKFLDSLSIPVFFNNESSEESAQRVWQLLAPLESLDGVIIEPINSTSSKQPTDSLYIKNFSIKGAPFTEPPFPTQHGVDSGILDPITLLNGQVLSLSRAVMAAEPTATSDKNLHSINTIVICHHTPHSLSPKEHNFTDESKNRWISAPISYIPTPADTSILNLQNEANAVYETSLYLSESTHALNWFDSVKHILILDGPIFPVVLLIWSNSNLSSLLENEGPSQMAIKNYIELIHLSITKSSQENKPQIPLIGFVKNPAEKTIKYSINNTGAEHIEFPWPTDALFFKQLLSSNNSSNNKLGPEKNTLSYTNWFISKNSLNRKFIGRIKDQNLTPSLKKENLDLYNLTFFMIYDPRLDIVYRVETPYAFSSSPILREKIETFILREIAIHNGPPRSIVKADHFARLSKADRFLLKHRLANSFGSRIDVNYNSYRWG